LIHTHKWGEEVGDFAGDGRTAAVRAFLTVDGDVMDDAVQDGAESLGVTIGEGAQEVFEGEADVVEGGDGFGVDYGELDEQLAFLFLEQGKLG